MKGEARKGWRTALVTGASSGIGRAFAVALAQRGADLVVIARRRSELDKLAADLIGAHGRSVEVLAADLTDPEERAKVEARLSDLDRPIDMLVNAAGFGTQGFFAELPVEREEQEILLNVVALVRLTRAALPAMVQRQQGAVVNLSSLAGDQAIPMWATYSATKAYVTTFSRAVDAELTGTGVRVHVVRPGFTRTEFHQQSGFRREMIPGPAWMTAEEVAEGALNRLARGRGESVPGLHYRALGLASRLAPRALTREVLRIATRDMR
ncbi:MAG: SDR family oxidoreductase [Actinomycetota bacterium]|nr:SDR family oxidoreductase [Actinomycetota bacterium]